MDRFTGINVRKGLELNVHVSDIFKLKLDAEGDIFAMKLHFDKWDDIDELKNKEYKDIFEDDGGIIYSTKREIHKINETLDAYVREVYMCFLEETEMGFQKISTERFTEIDFVNTEMLTLQSEDLIKPGFLENIMAAHEFTGKFNDSGFKNKFIGIGDFTLKEYLTYSDMITYSNVHFLDFFIFHNNILSSIGSFMLASYLKDLEEQKEYFTEEQYALIYENAMNHKNIIKKEFPMILSSLSGLSGGTF